MNNHPTLQQRVFYLLMSMFLFWQSYQLTISIFRMEDVVWGIQLLLALLINLFFTGVFAFAGFALPTEKLTASKILYHS